NLELGIPERLRRQARRAELAQQRSQENLRVLVIACDRNIERALPRLQTRQPIEQSTESGNLMMRKFCRYIRKLKQQPIHRHISGSGYPLISKLQVFTGPPGQARR